MTKYMLVLFFALALPVVAQKPNGPAKTVSPPEVRKTVEAIAGRWLGQMTARVPGAPAESFSWTMDCKPIALGAGASVY